MSNRHHRLYDKSPTSFSTKSVSAYSSDTESEESEGDDEEDFFLKSRVVDFTVGSTTNSVSITDSELFEENDEEYKYDPLWNPLDQGLLFKLLFRRFKENFIPKYNCRVNTCENLIMTNIFSKLASVPLWDKNIETYYLHAMIYCQFNNEPVSLLQSLTSISKQIKEHSVFPEFGYLKEEAKKYILQPDSSIRIKEKANKNSEELTEMMKQNRGLIEGSLIFDEFLKEYLTIFDAKNELIKIMNIYEEQFEEDLILDEALLRLTQVRKEQF
jgi:hypothetical protein